MFFKIGLNHFLQIKTIKYKKSVKTFNLKGFNASCGGIRYKRVIKALKSLKNLVFSGFLGFKYN